MNVSEFKTHEFFFICYPIVAGGAHLRNLMSLDSTFFPAGCSSHHEYYTHLIDWYKNPSEPTAHIDIEHFKNHFVGDELFFKYVDTIDYHKYHRSVHIGHAFHYFYFQNDVDFFTNKKIIVFTKDTDSVDILRKREFLHLGEYDTTSNSMSPTFILEKYCYSATNFITNFGVRDENIYELAISRWFNQDITSVIDDLNKKFQLNIPLVEAQNLHNIWYNKLWNF